jgi:hypothetical protein
MHFDVPFCQGSSPVGSVVMASYLTKYKGTLVLPAFTCQVFADRQVEC